MFAMGEKGGDMTEPCTGDGYLDGYNEFNVLPWLGVVQGWAGEELK